VTRRSVVSTTVLTLVASSALGVLAGGTAAADDGPPPPSSVHELPDYQASLPHYTAGTVQKPSARAMRDHQRTQVVPAHDFSKISTLDTAELTCGTTSTGTETYESRRGGTRGTHAIGWSFAGAQNVSAGVQVYLPDPESLLWFTSNVFSPTSGGSGYVFAQVYDPAVQGYWFGWNTWSNAESGWQYYQDFNVPLHWTYEENGASTPVGDSKISDFAGPDSTAWVGLTAGCDGAPVYLDELNAGDLESDITYDFEGLPSDSEIYRWDSDRKSAIWVQKPSSVTIGIGAFRYLLGDTWDWGPSGVFEDGDDGSITGTLSLYKKAYNASSYSKVTGSSVVSAYSDPDYYATFKPAPSRRTTYQVRYAGSDWYEGSRSSTVTINVRRAVGARVLDKELLTGDKLKVKGVLKPADKGIKLLLQRRVSGRWKTLRSGYSGTAGKYLLPFTVKSTGTWYVRVLALAGKGVVGNASQTRTITVKQRPKKVVYVPPKPEGDDTPDTTYTAPPPTTTTDTRPHLPRGALLGTGRTHG
jgi:hypothetical protein